MITCEICGYESKITLQDHDCVKVLAENLHKNYVRIDSLNLVQVEWADIFAKLKTRVQRLEAKNGNQGIQTPSRSTEEV